MKKLYSLIICLVVCIGIRVPVDAQTFNDYQKQKQEELAERRRVEKQRYESACKVGTLEAFQEYIKLYPKGRYATEVRNRIKDYHLWSEAVKTNTIEAYNNYIATSKFKSFKDKATEAITELQSIDKWKSIRSSQNIAEIEMFIKTYPQSSCIVDAQKRIHELKGVNFYLSNDLFNAYQEFHKAGGKYALEQANQSKFDECQEYWDYKHLNDYSREEQLLAFLRKYPSGKYSDEISNRIAISKAKSFNMYSLNTQFNEAIAYAKDESTKHLVEKYREICKKEYSQYKKQKRKARIKANGGYILFGVQPFDLGWGIASSNEYSILGYYDVGLSVKLGNFRSPVQFAIGIQPGMLLYDYADETQVAFHLSASAWLKINLCNIGRRAKLYMAGFGCYNIVRNDKLENKFALGGGIGFAWRHCDWQTLHYKHGIDNESSFNNQYLGTSFIYYF